MAAQLDLLMRIPADDTQAGKLLRHLQNVGPITTMEAYSQYGITCCGQRFTDLRRDGWPIVTEWYKTPSGARVARYSMARAA